MLCEENNGKGFVIFTTKLNLQTFWWMLLYSIHQSLSDLLAAKRVQLFWLQEINFDHREVSAMHLQQFQYTSMNI